MSWGGVPISKIPKILGQCAYARLHNNNLRNEYTNYGPKVQKLLLDRSHITRNCIIVIIFIENAKKLTLILWVAILIAEKVNIKYTDVKTIFI
jgi:hypothetical protein